MLEWVGTLLMQAIPVRLWPDSGTLWHCKKKKKKLCEVIELRLLKCTRMPYFHMGY